MSSNRVTRNVCLRLPEGERLFTLSTATYPSVCAAALGQCGLYVPFVCLWVALSDYVLVLHELRLIHTDLKPENILLVHNDYRVVHVPIPGKVRSVCTASIFKSVAADSMSSVRGPVNQSGY